MEQRPRRPIGLMPYRRRQDGLGALERREEKKLWMNIIAILTILVTIANSPAHQQILIVGVGFVTAMIARATAIRSIAWVAHPPINKVLIFRRS
jgi:cobalamin synthase